MILAKIAKYCMDFLRFLGGLAREHCFPFPCPVGLIMAGEVLKTDECNI
jgi:hypothetical protein